MLVALGRQSVGLLSVYLFYQPSRVGGGGNTVANQQTLTSYLTPGAKSSSRNHDTEPVAESAVVLSPSSPAGRPSNGNDAFNPVRKSGFSGANVSKPRSSSGVEG